MLCRGEEDKLIRFASLRKGPLDGKGPVDGLVATSSPTADPAVDAEDLKILRVMAQKPSLLWRQEQIESFARARRQPISRKTISNRWPILEEGRLIEKVKGKKGRRILPAGLEIVRLHEEASPDPGNASSVPVRKKARPPSQE
ncbi:MAG: hypothetical protein K8S99_14440 [Planctomycetes bacterium]|nr:hypothetical protein [Planctomycetota bacterium]